MSVLDVVGIHGLIIGGVAAEKNACHCMLLITFSRGCYSVVVV